MNNTEAVSLLVSITSVLLAGYAIYVSRLSSENQIINFVLTKLTEQTNHMEIYVNSLLAERTKQYLKDGSGAKDGRVIIDEYQWSYILTPLVKAKELFELYHCEYASHITPKQTKMILNSFYVQIPQLIKMRIFDEELKRTFDEIANEMGKIRASQLKTAREFILKSQI